MDIRGTKLFQRLHEWLAREPVYKLMREDRDSLVKDMRVIADAVCGKPDMRPGELLLKISDLKAEAAFGRVLLEDSARGCPPPQQEGLVGMMIHIPAKMFLNKRVREAYVDGYIAGKVEV